MEFGNILKEKERKFANKYLAKGQNKSYFLNRDIENLLHIAIKSRVGSAALLYERMKEGHSEINEHFDDIFNILIEELNDLVNRGDSLTKEEFDTWHNNLCNNNSYGMRYGVWQKIINITLKYLQCASNLFPEYSNIMKFAHCPIDKQICISIVDELSTPELHNRYYEVAYNISRGLNGHTWNFITEEEYKTLQNAIKDIIENNDMKKGNNYISNLEFDIINWDVE